MSVLNLSKESVSNPIETSYNQPSLSRNACWNPRAVSFATDTFSGLLTHGLFVDRNNSVYMIDNYNRDIHVWRPRSFGVMKSEFRVLFGPVSIFVTLNGDILIGSSTGVVERWRLGSARGVVVNRFTSRCLGLFVDIKNELYCSLNEEHQVVRQTVQDMTHEPTTIAGIGDPDSTSNALNEPRGIFVNLDFDLYVADSANHRVQLFHQGQRSGITVAGHYGRLHIILRYPTSVFLDGNSHLFIVDSSNSRIIRISAGEFQCVVGCVNVDEAAPNLLGTPTVAAFDSVGNIFVADRANRRVQKVLLTSKMSGKSHKLPKRRPCASVLCREFV